MPFRKRPGVQRRAGSRLKSSPLVFGPDETRIFQDRGILPFRSPLARL